MVSYMEHSGHQFRTTRMSHLDDFYNGYPDPLSPGIVAAKLIIFRRGFLQPDTPIMFNQPCLRIFAKSS